MWMSGQQASRRLEGGKDLRLDKSDLEAAWNQRKPREARAQESLVAFLENVQMEEGKPNSMAKEKRRK